MELNETENDDPTNLNLHLLARKVKLQPEDGFWDFQSLSRFFQRSLSRVFFSPAWLQGLSWHCSADVVRKSLGNPDTLCFGIVEVADPSLKWQSRHCPQLLHELLGKNAFATQDIAAFDMWYQHIITSIATEESCFSRFFVLGFIFFCMKSFRLSNPKIQLRDCGLVIDKKSRWPQDCERGFAIDHYFSPASCVSSVSSPQAQASDGKCKQKHLNFIMYLMYAGPIVQFPMNLTCKLIQGVTRCN